MPIPILNDADVRRLGSIELAIAAIEKSLVARTQSHLVAPPRHVVPFPEGALVFTIGGIEGEGPTLAGFRAYSSWSAGHERQITAVWNAAGLKGLILGDYLGALRTGAIGGVAIKFLANEHARTLGVLGSQGQSETQLLAAVAARPNLRNIRVYSPNSMSRRDFAARMSVRLGRPVEAVDNSQSAVEGADIVVTATDSTRPVLDLAWLKPGAHVNSLGPKFADAHELPKGIAGRAHTLVTDSLEQVQAFSSFFLNEDFSRLLDLSAVAISRVPIDRSDLTLFVSAGLAGTEVVVADAILDRVLNG